MYALLARDLQAERLDLDAFLFFFGSVGRQVPIAVRMGRTRVSDLESPLPLGTSIPLLVLGEV